MSSVDVVDQVSIGGWVRHPLCLEGAALSRRADRRAIAFTCVCTLDGAHGGERPYEGVPLAALIHEAEPAFEVRTDFKRVVIVAESVEGYKALFSWNELFNTDIGSGVWVAWNPEAPEGPFALLSTADHATGPRYVQRLAAVNLIRFW